MLETSCEKLRRREDLRETLQFLRSQAKDAQCAQQIKSLLQERGLLEALLQEEDPKVRKNAALLIGDLEMQQAAEALFEAYNREGTLFVKSACLAGLGRLDVSGFLQQLKDRMEILSRTVPAEDEKKHIDEELRQLSKILTRLEGIKRHRFTGAEKVCEIVLTTNRCGRGVTAKEAAEVPARIKRTVSPHPLGVLITTKDILPFARLRTYRELLFPIRIEGELPREPERAAAGLWRSNLWEFLTSCHQEEDPFYFRLEVRGTMDLSQKAVFSKKFASELERLSERRLINSPGDYEVEIRFLETKEGGLLPFLKLSTLPVNRFSYRKHTVSASIHPASAAMLVKLAQPYLKEGAQILDPFCGVGTMLIERDILVPAREKYGIDIFGEAIDGARENATLAGQRIHFVHRDYFDFTHEYLFDEIITNMPARGKKTKEETDAFYRDFFVKSKTLLAPEGKMILYTNEEGFVKKQLRLHREYRLLQEFCIREKEHYYLYIVGLKG